jgi:hypothetical protein
MPLAGAKIEGEQGAGQQRGVAQPTADWMKDKKTGPDSLSLNY